MSLAIPLTCEKYEAMKKRFFVVGMLLVALFPADAQTLRIQSPGKNVSLSVTVDASGAPSYAISHRGKSVVLPSPLGLQLEQASLTSQFTLLGADSAVADGTWKPVWGETREIRNNYRELTIHLRQRSKDPIVMDIIFRVFDDGVGFRYAFPSQAHLQHFVVKGETSGFRMAGDHKTFWIPGDYETNEYPYSTSAISKINAASVSKKATEISTRFVADSSSVQTPLMMKSAEGLYINIHEAALANYPAMQLHVDKPSLTFTSTLVPDAMGNMAYVQTPFATPWRTIVVAENGAGILQSKLILNLNEPCKIPETSWIQPQKMMGVWWELHIDKTRWDYADGSQLGANPDWSKVKPHGKHGATTANTKRYIDFAAAHGFQSVLVEGWNVGWEDWFGKWKEEVFDFVTPYPDFDVAELHRYASSKGVKLVMHHETSASVTNYERRMDDAYRFMKENGYDAVKTGYVGKIIPRGEHHDGQWMINHYNRVAAKAAEYKIMVDMHEPARPTGMHRTYPNWMASEATRGNEFNAWSVGNAPEHETILPFTRLMGGPIDYTPGIFQIKLDRYGKKGFGPHTTLTKQLALYVTMYSPLQMVADLPEHYQEHMDAFQFIKDVDVDWDDTRVVEAEPGDYLTMARKGKGKASWFIGSITDENKRTSVVPLSFLDAGTTYIATIYRDGPTAHWDKNPMQYTVEKFAVTSKTTLKIPVVEGGGYAVSIIPANPDTLKGIKKYK